MVWVRAHSHRRGDWHVLAEERAEYSDGCHGSLTKSCSCLDRRRWEVLCHLLAATGFLLELRFRRCLMTLEQQEQAHTCIHRGSSLRCLSGNPVGSDIPVDTAVNTSPRRCNLVESSLVHPWSSFLCIPYGMGKERCICSCLAVCTRIYLGVRTRNQGGSSRGGPLLKRARTQDRQSNEVRSPDHICSPA